MGCPWLQFFSFFQNFISAGLCECNRFASQRSGGVLVLIVTCIFQSFPYLSMTLKCSDYLSLQGQREGLEGVCAASLPRSLVHALFCRKERRPVATFNVTRTCAAAMFPIVLVLRPSSKGGKKSEADQAGKNIIKKEQHPQEMSRLFIGCKFYREKAIIRIHHSAASHQLLGARWALTRRMRQQGTLQW